jgi:hypothetical protein
METIFCDAWRRAVARASYRHFIPLEQDQNSLAELRRA